MDIIWSNTANINYRKNLDYLEQEWSYAVLMKFIEETEDCINKVALNPNLGQFDELIGCHKILIVKQMYMLYEISNKTLYIHNFWNNKRKPYWL